MTPLPSRSKDDPWKLKTPPGDLSGTFSTSSDLRAAPQLLDVSHRAQWRRSERHPSVGSPFSAGILTSHIQTGRMPQWVMLSEWLGLGPATGTLQMLS